jgi:hypothetical protein
VYASFTRLPSLPNTPVNETATPIFHAAFCAAHANPADRKQTNITIKIDLKLFKTIVALLSKMG